MSWNLNVPSAGGDWETAPSGLHQATCVDVVDRGEVQTEWGMKRKARIVWLISAKDSQGRHMMVSKNVTPSLHKKAALRQLIEQWLGRKLADGEGIDLESLVGKSCMILVQQQEGTDGKLWANIAAIMPAQPGQAPILAENYTRVKDRDPQSVSREPGADEDVPF
jgi:hypothetical protein